MNLIVAHIAYLSIFNHTYFTIHRATLAVHTPLALTYLEVMTKLKFVQVPLTGCGINPARSLATNIIEGAIGGDFYVSSFVMHGKFELDLSTGHFKTFLPHAVSIFLRRPSPDNSHRAVKKRILPRAS